MKKQLLTILAAGVAGSMFAQLPASTVLGNKKALIEEFTGVYCGYCPDGHSVGNGLVTADPLNVVLLNIHSGSFANVAPGEPDLTTPEGTAIDGMSGMGITGYPAGDVNRTVLVGAVMAAGRGSWSGMAGTIKTQTAYCNVAVQATLDATSRVLTVQAQVYYTANSPVSSNSLTIMLLENKIQGPQHNYGSPTPYNASNYNVIDNSYNHNHALRKVVTPTFGLNIPTTSMGSTFNTTQTYTIPATYGAAGKTTPAYLGNMELIAFVTQTSSVTINVAKGPITIVNYPNAIDGALTYVTAEPSTCAGILSGPIVKLSNYSATTMTSAVLGYSVAGGATSTYTFTGSVAPYTYTLISLPSYSFTPSAANTLNTAVVAVNGIIDPITANNVGTASIPKTTNISNSTYIQMAFTQDANGAAVKWQCIDEATGAIVGSDGPFTNLGVAGTKLWNKTFDVVPSKCYKVIVTDDLGDGINAGIGTGGWALKANGTPLVSSNGVFEYKQEKWFATSASANAIGEISETISNVSVYPNPAKNSSSISLDLVQNETVTISVLSIMGQVVYSQTLNNLPAGNHTIALNTENWANGMYNVNISTSTGTANRKLEITK